MKDNKLIDISNDITSAYPYPMTLQSNPIQKDMVETLFNKRLEIMNDTSLTQRFKNILFNINWGILNGVSGITFEPNDIDSEGILNNE